MFSSVEYMDASLDEIADFVRMRSREIRPPGLDLVLIPTSIGSRRVERLSLQDVSAASMINYVAEITSTSITYEDDAVVLRDATVNSDKISEDKGQEKQR